MMISPSKGFSRLLLCGALLLLPAITYAKRPQSLALAAYVGQVTSVNLGSVLKFHWHWDDSTLIAGEVNYTPRSHNPFQRFFHLLKLQFEISGNVTYQADKNGSLIELNPFIDLRWNHFPWNRYLQTSFMVGEGISYATQRPFQEIRDPQKQANARQLLNLLVFELGFSLPKHPQWQWFYRVHHRSGAYGFFCPGIVGSTAVALGLRYRFP